ncbi:hypothetical protein DFJ73DRAFT_524581 [Zopfochytrium polystomum]|nr:hypothetical protein DFJ73DRAFT_524581 [Zopfochytrium polystomum]
MVRRDQGHPAVPDRGAGGGGGGGDTLRVEWWDTLPQTQHSYSATGLACHAAKLAARGGHVAVLDWWVGSWLDSFPPASMSERRRADEIAVLDWCRAVSPSTVLKSYCYKRMPQEARSRLNSFEERTYTPALHEWWGRAGGVTPADLLEIDFVDEAAQLAQLKARKDAGARLDLRFAVIFACLFGQVAVLDWIRDCGLFPTARWPNSAGARSSHLAVLRWWSRHFGVADDSRNYESISEATRRGRVEVLQFWWDRGPLSRKFLRENSAHMCAEAARRNLLPVLRWWADRLEEHDADDKDAVDGVQRPLPAARVAELASEHGHTDILDWLSDSGRLPPRPPSSESFHSSSTSSSDSLPSSSSFSSSSSSSSSPSPSSSSSCARDAIAAACRGGHVRVLDWWKRREAGGAAHLLASDRGSGEAGVLHLCRTNSELLRWWTERSGGVPVATPAGLDLLAVCAAIPAAADAHGNAVRVSAAVAGALVFPTYAATEAAATAAVAVAADYSEQGLDALQWWLEAGLPPVLAFRGGFAGAVEAAVAAAATAAGRVEVSAAAREWWRRSGLEVADLPPPTDRDDLAARRWAFEFARAGEWLGSARGGPK